MTLALPAERPMSGRQKLAIVFMSVGPEVTAKLGVGLTPEELEQISLEIAQTDRVAPEVVEGVLAEWLEATLSVASLTTGGLEFARDVLERAYGKAKADVMLKRIQHQLADTVGMPKLRKLDPQQLATTLRGEHPQTAALVLAHLEPAHTAAILRELAPAFGGEVMYRMAKMEKVAPEMLQLVERALSSDADLTFTTGMAAAGGPAAVASVLNLVSGSLEKELVEGFAARDAALADQIKNLMFVFEDLVALDDKSLQRLLREVDAKQLALALKAASEDLKGKILGAMSQRAVAALKEEMEFMGPVRMRDVETAQTAIVTQVRKLEESGEIVLSAGGDDVLV
ncbi:flagellar motor switch protein FliG [Gemmatimonadetes bacterium T265]|nr:flagellar motor switch protein FliG [Gemmatimonadetes bacterium T265]